MNILKIWGDKRKMYLFWKEYQVLLEQSNKLTKRFLIRKEDAYPCLNDRTITTGFDRHYIYHPAWAARILRKTMPSVHVDISSILYFSAILSAFINVEFYDYRPADIHLDNLISKAADLTSLHFPDNSVKSLSCMHTVEHVGLGRYGDTLDYEGDLKAMKELARVLATSGNLLFAVPVGGEAKICFNAHRIYTKDQIINHFNGFGLRLIEFTFISEDWKNGGLIREPSDKLLQNEKYGCGCFWFTK